MSIEISGDWHRSGTSGGRIYHAKDENGGNVPVHISEEVLEDFSEADGIQKAYEKYAHEDVDEDGAIRVTTADFT